MRVLDDLPQWQADMLNELRLPRFRGGKFLRVHDSGDFFSDDYTLAWLSIAREVPDVIFYAYTKEVHRFKRLVEPSAPQNFRWLYSFGGRQDELIEPGDRVADVFPDRESLVAAGFSSQEESDLLAVLGPPRVGVPANNIPRFKRLMGNRSFRQWQAQKRSRHGSVKREGSS
jgi:hypothetical protein